MCVLIKQKNLTCIPREHKPFWQLSRLNDFVINTIAHLFIRERLNIPEAYSEPSITSKMELFPKIVKGKTSLSIFAKSFTLDVRLESEYVSISSFTGTFYIF